MVLAGCELLQFYLQQTARRSKQAWFSLKKSDEVVVKQAFVGVPHDGFGIRTKSAILAKSHPSNRGTM
jgi:hypothetical protein